MGRGFQHFVTGLAPNNTLELQLVILGEQ
jgi:hypothetical protein